MGVVVLLVLPSSSLPSAPDPLPFVASERFGPAAWEGSRPFPALPEPADAPGPAFEPPGAPGPGAPPSDRPGFEEPDCFPDAPISRSPGSCTNPYLKMRSWVRIRMADETIMYSTTPTGMMK